MNSSILMGVDIFAHNLNRFIHFCNTGKNTKGREDAEDTTLRLGALSREAQSAQIRRNGGIHEVKKERKVEGRPGSLV